MTRHTFMFAVLFCCGVCGLLLSAWAGHWVFTHSSRPSHSVPEPEWFPAGIQRALVLEHNHRIWRTKLRMEDGRHCWISGLHGEIDERIWIEVVVARAITGACCCPQPIYPDGSGDK